MHDIYENPLITRYASKEMSECFSDDKKYGLWRRLWIALAESEKELGLPITDEQIAEMEKYKDDINYVFKGTSFTPWNKLLKKSFIVDNNIYFSNKKLSEDQIFTIKAKVLANKIIYTPVAYYTYNVHPKSSSTTPKEENIHFEDIIFEIEKFFKAQNLYSEFKNYIDEAKINIVKEHYNLCPHYLRKKFLKKAKNFLDDNLFKEFYKNKKIENKNKFIENIFSLKNEHKFGVKYKRVTFLGFKFEFIIRR